MPIKGFRTYPDNEILKLMQNNDEAALEILFQRYYKMLCEFVRIYTRDDAVCEEIIADLFVKLWKNRSKLEVEHLKSYLFISARNQALNFVRKPDSPVFYMDRLEDFENFFYDEGNPHRIMSDREACDSIFSFIDLLPERQKEVLLMSRIDNLGKERIAEILSISVRTVETTLYAAVSQLRTIMNRHNRAT
ncbi:RNA polymerase sigma factor [Pararcticibacter amylolyticus]|uniref:RNA polymerase sigma-70 factor n=1 Tax=Pararcticibacter amylolyticus TaxID=2173175 RepID=A0A2U2PHG4_9SPHI|nr:sigma-70 family RNA polymerase sigma factor [Pararcticibacter amylolyticus]PWG80846.1 hypothetical protein DDR33_10350 [Pararcticibacter amylolyticus]